MRQKTSCFVLIFMLFWITPMGLDAREIDYKQLYQSAAPSVVLLYGTDGQTASTGTGSIIDASGLVLTNTHVVAKGKDLWEEQYVVLKPERVTGDHEKDLVRCFHAKVLALNPEYDLALVQIIDPPADLSVLALSDLNGVDIGEPTVAIGHPGGGAHWSMSTGRISASFEDYNATRGWDVFQTETSLNPGNSGGPLLDGSGAIVGINTFIIRQNQSGLALTGLNFAVKSSTARTWIQEVIGRLPEASQVRPEAAETPSAPDAGDIVEAPPPAPKEEKPDGFVTQGDKKRESELPSAPPRAEDGFKTDVEPGQEFGGDDLEAFFKRRQAALDNYRQKRTSDFEAFKRARTLKP
jgi:serine protease Do